MHFTKLNHLFQLFPIKDVQHVILRMGHRTVDYAAVDNIRHSMEVPKNNNLNNR